MFFKDGSLEGVKKKFSPEGKLLVEANYKNNQFDGVVREFQPNGNLRVNVIMRQGKRRDLPSIS